MKDFEIVRSAEGVRALAHEQRLEILRLLVPQPRTATMVAEELGRPTNQVHYHIRQLVEQSLLHEVADLRPHRKGERFYRAAARQFLVDPSLTGPDDAVSQSVLQTLEVSALQRRRREDLDLDLGRLARRVVDDCLGIEKDQKVLVVYAPPALELAENLLVELQAVGAETRTKIWSRNVILQTLDRHTPESLADLPFLHDAQNRDLDAMILVVSSIPQGAPPSPEQRAKLPGLLDAVSSWQRSLRERGVRSLEISLPHRGEFEGGWASPEEAIDTYWRCLDADPHELRIAGESVRARIGEGRDWRLSDANGTDLAFDVLPRPAQICDGVISEDDVSGGLPDEVLPAGQVTCLPEPNSANGSIWTDYTFVAGRHFYDVYLTIHDGRIVEARAREDSDALISIIRGESGDPDLLASVGIGLNPGGRTLTGRPSLDALLSGVVTISFGNNELDGGTVRSTLTLNLPSRSMTVVVGNQTLVAGGILSP